MNCLGILFPLYLRKVGSIFTMLGMISFPLDGFTEENNCVMMAIMLFWAGG